MSMRRTIEVQSKSHERKRRRFQVTLPFEHFSMSSEDCNHNGTRVSLPQENDKLLPVWNEFCFDILLRCSRDEKKDIINENRAQWENFRAKGQQHELVANGSQLLATGKKLLAKHSTGDLSSSCTPAWPYHAMSPWTTAFNFFFCKMVIRSK